MAEHQYDFVYRDTVDFINCIINDYDFYGEMIRAIQNGDTEISLHKKQLLKQIDENWVFAIENALSSLDMVIRNPMKALEEHEEVLPIELSRSISEKSIRHLAQHTNLINDIDAQGNITPSHLLNVYRDETIATYENKFVNTLLDRLFFFVEKRYMRLKEAAADESSTVMDFKTAFNSDRAEANVHFTIEIKNKEQSGTEELDEFGIPVTKTTMWERVERIRGILSGYLGSDFCKKLQGQFVRPPIMRTNAITKNKDLKVCLELWQFIESYDKIGYEIRANETAEAPSQAYVDELYSLLALQYVTFKYNVDGALDEEKALAARQDEEPVRPRIITDFRPVEVEEFNVYDVQTRKYVKWSQTASRKRLSPDELKVRQAVDNALAADKRLKELEILRQKELARIEEEKRQAAERERLRKAQEKEAERLRKLKEREKKKRHSKKGRQRAKVKKRKQEES